MRLSWYADTGVAVFSIWQGGTCTGTFRLTIADLPRMIQALQRGPDGDAGGAAPQPATGQMRRGDPGRDPQPPAPGNVIETGGRRARSGRHQEADRAGTSYAEDLLAGYGSPRPSSGYGDEHTGEYRRHGGAEPPMPYGDEPPAGAFHEDDAGYPDDDRGRYELEPAGPYPDDSLPGSSAPYRDDVDYEPEPAGPYPGGRRGRYEPEPTAAYPGGEYEDEPTGVYRGDLLSEGYDDDRDGRYPAGEYPDGPPDGDYPTGPSEADYPDAPDPRDYPGPPRDSGYSPARPYVGPRRQEAGPPPEERAHEPRRPRGRREAPPAPDSFPYGPPPSERETRGRSR
jgi:hypothetical protein